MTNLIIIYNLKLLSVPPSGSSTAGMVSVLTQTNDEGMDSELANQDVAAIEELDQELREEGINVSNNTVVKKKLLTFPLENFEMTRGSTGTAHISC